MNIERQIGVLVVYFLGMFLTWVWTEQRVETKKDFFLVLANYIFWPFFLLFQPIKLILSFVKYWKQLPDETEDTK